MRCFRGLLHFVCGLGLLVSACALNGQVKQADLLVSRGRYTEALEVYRRAQQEDPKSQELKEKIGAAKALESNRLAGMARKRLADRDYERAFDLFADATRYNPDNAEARSGLEQTRELWMAYALELETQGRPAEALNIYEAIRREFFSDAPCLEAIARVHSRKADEYRKAAKDYLVAGLPGNALIESLRAQSLRPQDADVEHELQEAVEQLHASSRFLVRIRSTRKSQFVDAVWSLYLTGVFEEAGLPISVEVGLPEGATLGLELNGFVGKITSSQVKVTGTLRVQQGVLTTPNPAWAELKAKVDVALAAQRALETPVHALESELDRLVRDRQQRGEQAISPTEEATRRRLTEAIRPYQIALEDYQRLSAQLARLPEVFEEPSFVEYSYPVTEVTKAVRVSCEIRIQEVGHPQATPWSISELISATDRTNPLLKAAGSRPEIPPDPLELPDDRTLRLHAETKAMMLLEQRLRELYYQHVAELWRLARQQVVAGEVDVAVETFLRAYIMDPRQPLDEAVRYIMDAKRTLGLPVGEFLQSSVQGPTHTAPPTP